MMRGEGRTVVRIRKMQLKIVLVGERRVGKTSLLERYLKNHFSEEYTGTLGGRIYATDLEVALDGDDIALAHIAFYDLMGEHSVRKVFAEPFFFGTQGVLAVCDVERPETLHLIKDWMDVVAKIAGPVPVGIVFNKIDRADAMAIGPEETAWLRKEFPTAPTFMTSARTGQGVEDAFTTMSSRSKRSCKTEPLEGATSTVPTATSKYGSLSTSSRHMRARVRRWGNGLALRIRKRDLEAAGVSEGNIVEVRISRLSASGTIDLEAMPMFQDADRLASV